MSINKPSKTSDTELLAQFMTSDKSYLKIIIKSKVKLVRTWLEAPVYILGTLVSGSVSKSNIEKLESDMDVISYTITKVV